MVRPNTPNNINFSFKSEFKKKSISFKVKPWLDNWWRIILKGAWHAPVIMVNGKVFSQGVTIKRKDFAKHVLSLL